MTDKPNPLPIPKDPAAIQRAHDILHFLGTDRAPALFDTDGCIATHAAHDALAWVLGYPCGDAFAANLTQITDALREGGIAEIDFGRPLSPDEIPEELR